MSQHALGFDVGISGVRAAVVRDDGALVASARRSHQRARMEEGIAEHDPADWLQGLLATGREALAATEARRIDAIGVAALGPAPILVDDYLRPLTNALLFGLDRRAEPLRPPDARGGRRRDAEPGAAEPRAAGRRELGDARQRTPQARLVG